MATPAWRVGGPELPLPLAVPCTVWTAWRVGGPEPPPLPNVPCTVWRVEGPALPLAFLVAGGAAGLAALCYADLASRCPSAGSAYHYAYATVGEG